MYNDVAGSQRIIFSASSPTLVVRATSGTPGTYMHMWINPLNVLWHCPRPRLPPRRYHRLLTTAPPHANYQCHYADGLFGGAGGYHEAGVLTEGDCLVVMITVITGDEPTQRVVHQVRSGNDDCNALSSHLASSLVGFQPLALL